MTLVFVHPSLLTRYELVPTLARQQQRRRTNRSCNQNRNAATNRTQDPARIQLPPWKEAIVIVIEISLSHKSALYASSTSQVYTHNQAHPGILYQPHQ